MDISQLLRFCVDSHASDLHLSAGLPPMLRVHGELRRTELPTLNDQEIRSLLEATMTPTQRDAMGDAARLDATFDERARAVIIPARQRQLEISHQ